MEDTKNKEDNNTKVENKDLVVADTKLDDDLYAILQETSGEECESWYYFLKYKGNEEALEHLNKQLESVEWYIIDDLSTFDLEIKNLVHEQTAKEMCNVDLNHYSFHRKFDGKLKKINLGFKDHYNNEKKMTKAFDVLGYGQIEDYIDKEDVDPTLLVTRSESDSDNPESSLSSTSTDDEDVKSSESSKSSKPAKKQGKIPTAIASDSSRKHKLPGFAKAKAKRNNKKK